MLRILIVEDDDDLRESLVLSLRRLGHEVDEATSLAAARRHLPRVDLLLTDLRLPDGEGTTLMQEGRRENPRLQVIVMTGYATVESAITATRSGARDYLLKPFAMEALRSHVIAIDALFSGQAQTARAPGGLVAQSPAMRRVLSAIEVAAASYAPVLIEGETGTGKELVACAIHQRSSRADQPLVAVNLAALPSELVDSELFGHERGAFTGAQQRRLGRFSMAARGTLLLDEINSLPLELQPKLLRAIEAREVWPVGAERPMPVQARIIAASNQILAKQVDEGRFRADLFYRLNVLRINVPPLRERVEDLPLLVRALLDQLVAGLPGSPAAAADVARPALAEVPSSVRPPAIEISSEALGFLRQQRWPGNVRELRNLLERALLQSAVCQRVPARLELADLDQLAVATPSSLPFKAAQAAASEAWSRSAILDALREAGGNRAQAAKRLQMNRSALFKLMKKLGLRD